MFLSLHPSSFAGGDTLGDALLYAAVGMFNYKTDLQGIRIDHPAATRVVTAEGACAGDWRHHRWCRRASRYVCLQMTALLAGRALV